MNIPVKRPPQLTFARKGHGVMVRRGFNEIFLTWKSLRDLDTLRDVPRVEDWLIDLLTDGPVEATAIRKAARERRIRPDILQRARKSLGIRKRKHCWQLPELFQ